MALTKRKKWGVALILLPGVLLVATLVVQIVMRFALTGAVSNTADCQTSVTSTEVCSTQEGGTLVVKRIINIFTLLLGAAAIFGGLPAVIGGIVLLATPGKQTQADPQQTPYQGPPAI